MVNYLGRREKGVKKIREKGDENLGDMGPCTDTDPNIWLRSHDGTATCFGKMWPT